MLLMLDRRRAGQKPPAWVGARREAVVEKGKGC